MQENLWPRPSPKASALLRRRVFRQNNSFFRQQDQKSHIKSIATEQQRLVLEGRNLGTRIRQITDGRPPLRYYIDDRFLLDEKFDYDFTRERDDGTEYYRGGMRYCRPYGWIRFGVNVQGKYGDDAWLGAEGIRTDSNPGEWPVAYHAVWPSIARGGYDSGRSERARFGKGIYSTPSIDVAEQFAEPFKGDDGNTYKLVYQNRVSTEGLEIEQGRHGEYWLHENDRLIRPYGLCFKVVSIYLLNSSIFISKGHLFKGS